MVSIDKNMFTDKDQWGQCKLIYQIMGSETKRVNQKGQAASVRPCTRSMLTSMLKTRLKLH